jgi:two-component system, cell cycle response regulator
VTLRARLTLFFVGIVVVPLVVAAFVVRGLVNGEVERRTDSRLGVGARSVTAFWEDRLELAAREVSRAARAIAEALPRGQGPPDLDRLRSDSGLDFLVLSGPDGVIGSSLRPPEFLPGVDPPGPEQLTPTEPSFPLLRATAEVVTGSRTLEVAGGWYADRELAADLARLTGMEASVVADGRVVAATESPPGTLPADDGQPHDLSGGRRGLFVPLAEGGDALLLVADDEPSPTASTVWLVALFGVVVATVLGWMLARLISRPVERLAEGAREVSAGNLDVQLETEGERDLLQVADAFNQMTENLRAYVAELEGSRDELRRNMDRLGQTLRSTHDLEAMLGVILETAVSTLRARAGAAFLLSPSGREMQLEVARGYRPASAATLPLGAGIAGEAAAGQPILLPNGAGVAASMPVEPDVETAVAVPLIRGERTIGVLALYGRTSPEPFQERDAATLESFATQASVGIENVLLHQEAERLSITDGLTGVWNRRYLQLTLTKEIDRADRFDRPLSLLMIDIDRFKGVNDAHGHQRGDEVLVELTRRILGSVRTQIDVLARYGGEEFVIVLPETPPAGARVVAEKVRTAIGDEPFQSEDGPSLAVTVSIGVASYPADGMTADELVAAADGAMYRAKEAGRDRVEAFSAG